MIHISKHPTTAFIPITGSVYALLHSVQSIVAFLGPVAHNAIFAGSLKFMGGLVFLVSGPILIVPFVLLL